MFFYWQIGDNNVKSKLVKAIYVSSVLEFCNGLWLKICDVDQGKAFLIIQSMVLHFEVIHDYLSPVSILQINKIFWV